MRLLTNKFLSVLIFIVATSLSLFVWVSPNWNSGKINSSGEMIFDETYYRDSAVHLSLIGEIKNRFPPTNFANSGTSLKNYHYLLDSVIAATSKITGIDSMALFFRVFPVLIGLTFCFSIFWLVFELTRNFLISSLSIFIVVFSTSFGFFVQFVKPLFFEGPISKLSNIFMSDQIFTMMINPHGVLSLAIYILLIYSLIKYEKSGKYIYLTILGVLIGVSFGIKAYGGIVFLVSMGGVFIYNLFFRKDLKLLISIALGILVAVIWAINTIDRSVSGISFAPFWLLEHMVSDYERLNIPLFSSALIKFQNNKEYLKLFFAFLFSFLIYFVGSTGTRLIGLLAVPRFVGKHGKINLSLIFLTISAIISFLIPLISNQGRKPFDIIQFTPYYTVAMSLLTCIFLNSISKKYSFGYVAIITYIILILLIDSSEIQNQIGNRNTIRFPASIVQAAEYIKNNTPVDSIFLLPNTFCTGKTIEPWPWKCNMNDLWFSSLTERRTYLSGDYFNYQVGVDFSSKNEDLNIIVNSNNLAKLKFDYYFKIVNQLDPYKDNSLEKELENIYKSKDVEIYKIY